jgi:hypothetical protein
LKLMKFMKMAPMSSTECDSGSDLDNSIALQAADLTSERTTS